MSASTWTALRECGCCGSARAASAGRIQGVGLLRCDGCDTLRFEAVVAPDAVYTDGYHDGSVGFGWDYASSGARGYEEATAAQRLDFLARFVRPGKLLDVGGGLGYFAAAAARRGWTAELLEPVPAAAEHARAELGIPVHVGGSERLGEFAGAFDLISFLHCIEHIPRSREAFMEARRALSDTGLLFVEVPNHGSLARRWQGERWLGWQAGEHVYVFTKRTLLGLLRRSGFEPVAVRTYVPGWDGLDPNGYAHMLGLRAPLSAAVSLKRRLRRPGAAQPVDGPPVPIEGRSPGSRIGYSRLFGAAARAEERLGVGTNIQVLARPAGRG